MKEMTQEKYLGDYLHCNGNPDSVAATVQVRSGLAVSAVNEIRSVLEDCRVNVAGGICAGIDIYISYFFFSKTAACGMIFPREFMSN